MIAIATFIPCITAKRPIADKAISGYIVWKAGFFNFACEKFCYLFWGKSAVPDTNVI
jgi:hypothetical protein